MFNYFIFLFLELLPFVLSYTELPVCKTPLVYYNDSTFVDVAQTITNCASAAVSLSNPPCIWPGSDLCTISPQLVLNNLMMFEEINQYVVIDLKLRLSWKDSRLNIPKMFTANPPVVSQDYLTNGIEILPLVQSGSIKLWLPDIVFIGFMLTNSPIDEKHKTITILTIRIHT